MKKISVILAAFALAMTMSQCKKNEGQPTSNDEVVTITLDVKNNNGSRVDVNTTTGTVDFETGDKVFVGSGGKYVGFLTHNGTNFVGNITNPTENQPLQFYFLGNVTPTEMLSAGTTEECSVIISDQTEHLPVISCAASNENYVSGLTSYTGHLLNKCALVKFIVTTPSNSPICITGMKNKVTVDFTQNTMTPSMDGEGVIMLPAGSGENVEKWAILLPQEALEEGEEGSTYSEHENYTGIRPGMPMITENGYLAEGIGIIVNNCMPPVGAINGLFSVSPSQKVYFSQGNLQYQASTNSWRFALNQWDYVGGTYYNSGTVYENGIQCNNELISNAYNGWIDLFGWGTSGYNHGAICYQPWSTSTNNNEYYAYGLNNANLYDYDGRADWGCNAISNGGGIINGWRTLTVEEWNYVFNVRATPSGILFAKAVVNERNGVIIIPDNWDASTYYLMDANNQNASFQTNIISVSTWLDDFEENGAVFIPAAGSRNGSTINAISTAGYYMSSSYFNNTNIYGLFFRDDVFYYYDNGWSRKLGCSVRLVQDYQP